jgi:hypothetical protein
MMRARRARGDDASALFVTLEAVPNYDFSPGGHEASLRVRAQKQRVADLADASRVVQLFIREHELGGGNWSGGLVTDASGKAVGRVSYNGRVWSPDENVLLLEAVSLRGHR